MPPPTPPPKRPQRPAPAVVTPVVQPATKPTSTIPILIAMIVVLLLLMMMFFVAGLGVFIASRVAQAPDDASAGNDDSRYPSGAPIRVPSVEKPRDGSDDNGEEGDDKADSGKQGDGSDGDGAKSGGKSDGGHEGSGNRQENGKSSDATGENGKPGGNGKDGDQPSGDAAAGESHAGGSGSVDPSNDMRPAGSHRDHDGSSEPDKVQLGGAKFFDVQANGEKFAFVLELSEKMSDFQIQSIKTELRESLGIMLIYQSFHICFYNQQPHSMPSGSLVLTTQENVELAERWLNTIKPRTGANPVEAILQAIELRPDAIFLLSTGGVDPRVAGAVEQSHSKPIPIYTIQLSAGAQRDSTLQKIARASGGQFTAIP